MSPLKQNGFDFNSCKHIAQVNCPIMILHAKDDTVIHYKFAKKVRFNIYNK